VRAVARPACRADDHDGVQRQTPSGRSGADPQGQIGGVILFGANVGSLDGLKRLIAQLQAAARAGGNPPLLFAVDQEGGS